MDRVYIFIFCVTLTLWIIVKNQKKDILENSTILHQSSWKIILKNYMFITSTERANNIFNNEYVKNITLFDHNYQVKIYLSPQILLRRTDMTLSTLQKYNNNNQKCNINRQYKIYLLSLSVGKCSLFFLLFYKSYMVHVLTFYQSHLYDQSLAIQFLTRFKLIIIIAKMW